MGLQWRAECKTCPRYPEPNYGAMVASERCEDEDPKVVDTWRDEHLARFPDHVVGTFQTITLSASYAVIDKDVLARILGIPGR